MELQKLQKSFVCQSSGQTISLEQERAIYHCVDKLGAVALPMLMRKLQEDALTGRWASLLLIRLSQEPKLFDRICIKLRTTIFASRLGDQHKLRAADLLATLQGHNQELPALAMPQHSAELSLVDLAACIDTSAEIAYAIDILIHDLPPQELIEFMEDMVMHQPSAASLLLTELLLRDDLDRETLRQCRHIQLSLQQMILPGQDNVKAEAPAQLHLGQQLASHRDGSMAIISYLPISDSPHHQYRSLRILLKSGQPLIDCQYLDAASLGEIDRQLLTPLAKLGFEICPIRPGHAKQYLLSAVRAHRQQGLSFPRAYYLGRDIIGFTNEHQQVAVQQTMDTAALLAHGTALLAQKKYQEAKDFLIRYAKNRPDDSEAMATLGECLINTGQKKQAQYFLTRATKLAPKVGRHYWNLASLAHQEGRLGDCFQALSHYLRFSEGGAIQQREQAEQFIAQYRFQHLEQSHLAQSLERSTDSVSMDSLVASPLQTNDRAQ